MKFNYNLEIDNILNKIYKRKIFDLACNNNFSDIDLSNLKFYKDKFKSFEIYLGNEMEDFIKDSLPKEKEGYFFRCDVSNHKNNSYPKLYDIYGNKLAHGSDSKFAVLLWEEHINNLIIKDIYKSFTKEGFHNYIDNNLENIYEEINESVITSNNNKLTIAFSNKSELVSIIKEMILKNE